MDKQDELVKAIRSHFATDIAAQEVAAAVRSFMGSPEVVERGAKAIAKLDYAKWDAKDFTETPSGELAEEMRNYFRYHARAALSAAIGEDGGGRNA